MGTSLPAAPAHLHTGPMRPHAAAFRLRVGEAPRLGLCRERRDVLFFLPSAMGFVPGGPCDLRHWSLFS